MASCSSCHLYLRRRFHILKSIHVVKKVFVFSKYLLKNLRIGFFDDKRIENTFPFSRVYPLPKNGRHFGTHADSRPAWLKVSQKSSNSFFLVQLRNSSLIKDATLRGKSAGRVFASSSQTKRIPSDADKTPIA